MSLQRSQPHSFLRVVICWRRGQRSHIDNTIPTVMDSERLKLSKERTFACPDTLVPCVIKFCVASIAAVVEPSTVRSATTVLARFDDDTALGAPLASYCGCACRRERFCGHMLELKQHNTIQHNATHNNNSQPKQEINLPAAPVALGDGWERLLELTAVTAPLIPTCRDMLATWATKSYR